jgi:membrane-associated phospholipid phosphatase
MGSPTPDRSRAAAALATFGVLAGLAAALLGAVAIRTQTGQRIDDAGRGGVSAFDAPEVFRGASGLLDTISVASLALFGAGIVLVALLRGRPRLAVAAGVVLLGANVTTQIVKDAVDRPDLVYGWWTEPGAFPSGHTTVAMSLAMALMIVVPTGLRWIAAAGGCAYAAGVGVAVIALDWHRPSEVIGAYLVVASWTGLVMAVLTLAGEDPEREPGRLGRAATLVAGVLGAAFALVVALAAARRLDLHQLVYDRTTFAVASAVCAAACAAIGAVTTALVQRATASPAPSSADSLRGDARRRPHGRG